MIRQTFRQFVGVASLALALTAIPAWGQNSPHTAALQRIRRDTKWISAVKSRAVGHPGHDRVAARLEKEIRALGALASKRVRIWTQQFPVVVPRTRKVKGAVQATLTLSGPPLAGSHRVYPLWPAGVRLNTTPDGGLRGNLVYIGRGRADEISPHRLQGQIAVMEMTGRQRWQMAFSAGARAVILLGSEGVTFHDVSSHLIPLPINCPRFFVPQGPLADALRKRRTGSAAVKCAVDWVEFEYGAKNLFALVLPAGGAGKGPEPTKAFAIAVPYDSTGAVPELAPGADVAVDVACALEMLRTAVKNPPQGPLLFCFVDAYGVNQLGMRQMLAALALTPEDNESHVEEEQELIDDEYYPAAKLLNELPEDKPENVDDTIDNHLYDSKFRPLHRYIKDAANRQVLGIDAKLRPLNLEVFGAKGERKRELKGKIKEHRGRRQVIYRAVRQLNHRRDKDGEGKMLPIGGEEEAEANEAEKDARAKKALAEEEKARADELLAEAGRVSDKAKKAKKEKLLARESEHRAKARKLLAEAEELEKEAAKLRVLAKDVFAKAKELWIQTRRRTVGQMTAALVRREEYARHDRLRLAVLAALGIGDTEDRPLAKERPISFLLGLDLSDAGIAVGPLTRCAYLGTNERTNGKDFERWLELAGGKSEFVTETAAAVPMALLGGARPGIPAEVWTAVMGAWSGGGFYRPFDSAGIWPERLARAVNCEPLEGLDSPASHAPGNLVSVTSSARSFGIPSITWATLDAPRLRVDTPNDTFERLNWDRLNPQIEATLDLVTHLAREKSFRVEANVISRWTQARGQVVDRAAGEPIARVPMDGYLVTLVNGTQTAMGAPPVCPGVRRRECAVTGIDGRFEFNAWPAQAGRSLTRFYVQAYKFAGDGKITRAVDMSTEGKGVKLDMDARVPSRTPLRAVVFSCREKTLLDLYDPRFMVSLRGDLIDAKRGSRFKRYNVSFWQGMMAAQVMPTEKNASWQVILRAGVTRNRFALMNMVDARKVESDGLSIRKAMKGYELGQPLPHFPLHLAARDLLRLDQTRTERYRKAGITIEAVDDLQQRTEQLLKKADAILNEKDGSPSGADPGKATSGARYFAAISDAISNEIRTYQAVRETADDVIRGAIFLMLMLIPFSLAMERLLIGSPRIYRQIAANAIIFCVMTAVLWSFHPAFRISSQPLTIIMSFVIIAMSLLVLSVVYRKFETGLEEIRSGRAESSAASTSRFSLLVTALRLGIANMRKRKLRTTLTGLTVVLITFALLCFMSTSRYVDKKEFSAPGTPGYQGVLLRQPSNRPMPPRALEHLRSTRGATDRIVPRFWWDDPNERQWAVHVRNAATGKQISLPAALGLSSQENDVNPMRIDGRPVLSNWERFATVGGCYLADEKAEQLGVAPGDKVVVVGRELELIGTFKSSDLRQAAKDLDGQSMLPMDYSALPDEKRRLMTSQSIEILIEELQSGAAMMTEETDLPSLRGADVLILRADFLEGMGLGKVRSIAIPAAAGQEARNIAHDLARNLAYPVYFTASMAKGGIRVVGTTPLLPMAPKSLIVPLFIGGLIIFNTMLSAISERKREIYVYTSLGLAPLHVAFLFLAEAITYGLMGAVFGYIAGQGIAAVFDQFGWMGGITLNYSGGQAVTVMILVLLVVIASSLVPAYLGGRVATPSTERTWKVPAPDGDVIRDRLPFLVTPSTAPGVMGFLMEYLDAHREGSIGNFATDDLHAYVASEDGKEYPGLTATVWLAPYDQGVRQEMRLSLHPTEFEESLRIDVELRRAAGRPGTWWRLNRVFLGDLRRQLLGWRKVRSVRILEYIRTGTEMLAGAAREVPHA